MSECRVGIPEPTWERATLDCCVPVQGARPVPKAAWPEPEQSLPVLGAPKRPLWGDHASPSPSRGASAPEARTPCGAAERTQGSGSSCSRRAARLVYWEKHHQRPGCLQTSNPCDGRSAPEELGFPLTTTEPARGAVEAAPQLRRSGLGSPGSRRPRGRPGKAGAAPTRLEIGGVAPAREDVLLLQQLVF